MKRRRGRVRPSEVEQRRRGKQRRSLARQKRIAADSLLRNATRNATRLRRQPRTVVQISVRLTAAEDRALAGLMERGAFPSVTDAIRTLIRDRANLDVNGTESE